MLTTIELKEGCLLMPQAIVSSFDLKEGDLVEVALLRAFRRGGKIIDLEPARETADDALPKASDSWQDLS